MHWGEVIGKRKLEGNGPVVFSVSFPDDDFLPMVLSRNMLVVRDCEQLVQAGLRIQQPPLPDDGDKHHNGREPSDNVEAKDDDENDEAVTFETIWYARCGVCSVCTSKPCGHCAFCTGGGKESVMCIRKVGWLSWE